MRNMIRRGMMRRCESLWRRRGRRRRGRRRIGGRSCGSRRVRLRLSVIMRRKGRKGRRWLSRNGGRKGKVSKRGSSMISLGMGVGGDMELRTSTFAFCFPHRRSLFKASLFRSRGASRAVQGQRQSFLLSCHTFPRPFVYVAYFFISTSQRNETTSVEGLT